MQEANKRAYSCKNNSQFVKFNYSQELIGEKIAHRTSELVTNTDSIFI